MVVRKIKWRPLKVRTNSAPIEEVSSKIWSQLVGKIMSVYMKKWGGIILHDKRKLVYEKLAIPTKRLLVCVRNILY